MWEEGRKGLCLFVPPTGGGREKKCDRALLWIFHATYGKLNGGRRSPTCVYPEEEEEEEKEKEEEAAKSGLIASIRWQIRAGSLLLLFLFLLPLLPHFYRLFFFLTKKCGKPNVCRYQREGRKKEVCNLRVGRGKNERKMTLSSFFLGGGGKEGRG